MRRDHWLCVLLSLVIPSSYGAVVNEASIVEPGSDWLSYGRDYSEQRFSPLDEITRQNVDELDLAWSFDFPTARGMEATPLVHEGIIYVSTGWSHVYALNAETGEELWHFAEAGRRVHVLVVHPCSSIRSAAH